MRVLYLTDRLSSRGGADHHLLDVIDWAAGAGHVLTVASGRHEPEAVVPDGAQVVRLPSLASPAARRDGLDGLGELLADADLVHLQNVMNPVALERAAATGRALATVQDHRVFCPGPGRTLPDGRRCREPMGHAVCRACLPDRAYRRRLLALTGARRDALAGVRLVVLSRYMAEELAEAGLPGADVIPPWLDPGPDRTDPGDAVVLGGRLVRHKAAVDGWTAWRRSACGLPLRVIGAGAAAEAMAGAELLGWRPREEVRRELRQARALLFPARWQEPFGILGVESLAEGTPVVAADSGGTGDWSDRGCLRVPPGDVDAMAAALARLAADPEEALALGRAGQATVAERFAAAPLQRRLAALYAEVAGVTTSGAAEA